MKKRNVQAGDPPPQHSDEAEQAFLGAIMVGPYPGFTCDLYPSDFFNDDYRKIFAMMLDLEGQGRPPNDPVLLLDGLTPQEQTHLGPLISSLINPLFKNRDVA